MPAWTSKYGFEVVEGATTRLSVPRDALKDENKACIEELRHPQRIRSWIFTPTFFGDGRAGPEEKLLLRENAFCVPKAGVDGREFEQLQRWRDFAEVLVVRKSQYQAYRKVFGNTHVIAEMPDILIDPNRIHLTADSGGCGYVRLFTQLLADFLQLKAIWMIDDNVLNCWQMKCCVETVDRGSVIVEPATFAEAMLHIEALFYDQDLSKSTYPEAPKELQKMILSGDFLRRPFCEKQNIEPHDDPLCGDCCELQKVQSLRDIVGPSESYGIIGMARGVQWRDTTRFPVKVSYSVYSFFLLNIAETVSRKLFFPSRPVWEDIEFNILLDENNLKVCKLQMFAHCKPIRPGIEVRPSVTEELEIWLREKYCDSESSAGVEEISLGTTGNINTYCYDLYDRLFAVASSVATRNTNMISVVVSNPPSEISPVACKKAKRMYSLEEIMWRVYEATELPLDQTVVSRWVMIIPIDTHIRFQLPEIPTMLLPNQESRPTILELPQTVSNIFFGLEFKILNLHLNNNEDPKK